MDKINQIYHHLYIYFNNIIHSIMKYGNNVSNKQYTWIYYNICICTYMLVVWQFSSPPSFPSIIYTRLINQMVGFVD